MAEFSGKELTPELIRKAMAYSSAEELPALAKENDIAITPEEAAACLEEISDRELSPEMLEKISGGMKVCYVVDGCSWHC